ncbi:hypothetical protein [Kinneretia aquatilis]|uniref:hypothetical protein n=1 Tax=Kinneretia aquatilis TaxID=2070761 RepID=UPI0014953148|nr:hypothetical protein [Paucibacter aquatile]WIV96557.1 hypothetical protein K9V56_016140 [Paucibacter aquatile]
MSEIQFFSARLEQLHDSRPMTARQFHIPMLARLRPRRSSRHARSLPALAALVLVACLLAVFLGLLSTTASPILIGVFAGTFIGFGLLGFPTLSLWLVVIGTLVVGGMIAQFLPALNKANWLFSMLGFLLFISAIVATLMRRDEREPLPWWACLALAFPAYAIVVAVINQISVFEFLAGFKRYFQYWGLFGCLALLTLRPQTYRNLVRFIVGLALVQVFFAIFQRLIIVPQRQGMGGGVVAIDAVSGTFESSFRGGGSSAILVFFLLIVFAFVLRLWLDKQLSGGRTLLAAVLLLSPLALGETKVVVVLLPLVFLCALALDFKKRPVAVLAMSLLGIVLALALAALYVLINAKTGQSLERTVDNIFAYNFGNVGYHSANSLNRSTVLFFWAGQQHAGDPLGFLFGHGPGASYIGEGALVPGHLGLKYFGIFIAFTTLSSLLWDFGVLGLLAFLAFNFGAIGAMARAVLNEPPGERRSLQVAVLVGLLMNLLLLFMYNSATSLPSHSALFMLLLGAAVLLRQPKGRNAVRLHA